MPLTLVRCTDIEYSLTEKSKNPMTRLGITLFDDGN